MNSLNDVAGPTRSERAGAESDRSCPGDGQLVAVSLRARARVPWVDVPTTSYPPRCTCSPVTGSTVPLTDAELAARYGNRAGFEAEWSHALDNLVAERWLLPEDADILRADVARSSALHDGENLSNQK